MSIGLGLCCPVQPLDLHLVSMDTCLYICQQPERPLCYSTSAGHVCHDGVGPASGYHETLTDAYASNQEDPCVTASVLVMAPLDSSSYQCDSLKARGAASVGMSLPAVRHHSCSTDLTGRVCRLDVGGSARCGQRKVLVWAQACQLCGTSVAALTSHGDFMLKGAWCGHGKLVVAFSSLQSVPFLLSGL